FGMALDLARAGLADVDQGAPRQVSWGNLGVRPPSFLPRGRWGRPLGGGQGCRFRHDGLTSPPKAGCPADDSGPVAGLPAPADGPAVGDPRAETSPRRGADS